MNEPAPPVPIADAIAAALHYLQHFPEALDVGATLCLPTGQSVFIDAATVQAATSDVAQ